MNRPNSWNIIVIALILNTVILVLIVTFKYNIVISNSILSYSDELNVKQLSLHSPEIDPIKSFLNNSANQKYVFTGIDINCHQIKIDNPGDFVLPASNQRQDCSALTNGMHCIICIVMVSIYGVTKHAKMLKL